MRGYNDRELSGKGDGAMRTAVMADIHSNFPAFQACLRAAEEHHCTAFIFLGDYLGDMAFPQRTLGLLWEIRRRYPCIFIRGNKENYWIHHRQHPEEAWEYGNSATGMLRYNSDRLMDEDLDFFEQLPISRVLRTEGYPDIALCHGSPFAVRESLRPDYGYIDDLMERMPAGLVLCGHFHIQTDYTRKGIRVINPGAVGVPLGSGGKAQFMIMEGKDGAWNTEFLSVPYDIQETIRQMNEERLYEKAPGWYRVTRHVLLTGRVSHAQAHRYVMQRCGAAEPASIPESAWQEAIDAMEEETHLPKAEQRGEER